MTMLKLHTDDYLTAVGAVAIVRLCEQAERNLWHEHARDYIRLESDHLLVDEVILDYLPEWFFRSLLAQYSIVNRERKRLESYGPGYRYMSANEQLKSVRNNVNDNIKKLTRYFPDHPKLQAMNEVLNELKILSHEQIEKVPSIIAKYLELLAEPLFEEKLTFNFIRSVILKDFFGQVSYLQRTLNHYNLQQHIEKMYEDFIQPIKRDIGLHKILQRKDGHAEEKKTVILEYLEPTSNTLFNRWKRELKKLDASKVDDYFTHQLYCVFEEELLATSNFEEMTFAPFGISSKNVNFSWGLKQQGVPISSWIRLVLMLAPIGLSPYTVRVHGEFETYYSFIYRAGSPETIIRDNNELLSLENREEFRLVIPKIVERERHKARQEIKTDVQIVEFSSNIDSKKTVMNYYHIPRHMLVYLSEHAKLEFVRDRMLRYHFIRLSLESLDPLPVIWSYLNENVRKGQAVSSSIYAFVERLKINNLREGNDPMGNNRLIWVIYNEGKRVRDEIEQMSGKRLQTTDYASGGDKRAAGIAYRLLNTAKAGQKTQFLDSVTRLYLQVKRPIPSFFLNVLHEERIDFASVSGAFITGLLSQEGSQNNESETAIATSEGGNDQ